MAFGRRHVPASQRSPVSGSFSLGERGSPTQKQPLKTGPTHHELALQNVAPDHEATFAGTASCARVHGESGAPVLGTSLSEPQAAAPGRHRVLRNYASLFLLDHGFSRPRRIG